VNEKKSNVNPATLQDQNVTTKQMLGQDNDHLTTKKVIWAKLIWHATALVLISGQPVYNV